MEQLIRMHSLVLLLLLLLLLFFTSSILGGVRGVDARVDGQGIGTEQSNVLVATIRKGGGGHGGHGGHGQGHGNGGGERGRGIPETPPVFNPRTVAGNGNQHRGRSAAARDLSPSSTCVLFALSAAISLLHF